MKHPKFWFIYIMIIFLSMGSNKLSFDKNEISALEAIFLSPSPSHVSGSGTQVDPYLIYDAYDWDSIGVIGNNSSYWALANSINMNILGEAWRTNFDWGDRKFDGKGFSIDNIYTRLTFSSLSNSEVGIIVNNAVSGEFKNVIIQNADVEIGAIPSLNLKFKFIAANISTMLLDSIIIRESNLTVKEAIQGGGEGDIPVPPDPATVATVIDSTVVSTLTDAVKFLYTGEDASQVDVDTSAFEEQRTCVIKGKVLDENNNPLQGVYVSVLNRPEFGKAISRIDGNYDLVVNGGAFLTLAYKKSNYLSAQRSIQTAWQEYKHINDVVLVKVDSVVTNITFTDPIEVAKGSVVSDGEGTRQATLMFEQGTQATMKLPDGTTKALSNIEVRATEFTVGDNGLEKMPAELPPNSAYTYCLELTVDEALDSGATRVDFDKPIPFYVENFLDYPVGIGVPLGYYDTEEAQWVPYDNGQIIKVTNIIGGKAEIDIDGDDVAEDSLTLDSLGIDDVERVKIADQYAIGTSLWRMEIPHFSIWDANWGFGPPEDAEYPNLSDPLNRNNPASSDNSENNNFICGSIIDVQNQSLGESIDIVGTPFSLNYNSRFMPGYSFTRTLSFPVSGSVIPNGAYGIGVTVTVAGKEYYEYLGATPFQQFSFNWDGKDAYDRDLRGPQPAEIKVSYYYPGVQRRVARFGYGGGPSIGGSRALMRVELNQFFKGYISASIEGPLSGWTISEHHSYDITKRRVLKGTGEIVGSEDFLKRGLTAAGGGTGGDGGLAIDASLNRPSDVVVSEDGTIYFVDTENDRVKKIDGEGIITTVAGKDNPYHSDTGDGGLATNALLRIPTLIDIDSEGNIYIATSNRIRKVTTDGKINTVVGNGGIAWPVEGSLATETGIGYPRGLTVGPDGSIYVMSGSGVHYQLYKVDPAGIINKIAGGGSSKADTVDAFDAQFIFNIGDIDYAPDGSIYICDTYEDKIRKLSIDGVITTVAGTGVYDLTGQSIDSGIPAVDAGIIKPAWISVDTDGTIYFTGGAISTQGANNVHRIRKIDTEGIISTVAGSIYLSRGFSGDGRIATKMQFDEPRGIGLAPDGDIYVADYFNNRIRRITSVMPGFSNSEINIASRDGSEIYVFNKDGKHLKTLESLTSREIYNFDYNSSGLLESIIDIDSLVTNIEWSGGNIRAIVSPFGQRTEMQTDTSGYISSIKNSANETYSFEYAPGGLMTKMIDARGNSHLFTYDSLGLLIKDQNPEGGFTELERTNFTGGHEVKTTTAEGKIRTYKVENLKKGGAVFTNTDEGGLQTIKTIGNDGSITTVTPDSTIITIGYGPDPRFGLEAPIVEQSTIQTPGGINSVQEQEKVITLMEGFEIKGIADTVKINNKIYTVSFDGYDNEFIFTSPEGRTSITKIDTNLRVIQSSLPGISNVNYSYSSQGFLTEAAQGIRKTTFAYDSLGRIETITDPLNRTESYTYDNVGRIKKQALPNNEEILYAYDEHGNLTSITPPGKPAHVFEYTKTDLTSDYTPPTIPDGGSTKYVYNLDKQLTHIIQPDSSMIEVVYDTVGCGCTGLGKPSLVKFDRGQLNYKYDEDGNISSIITPENDSLSYEYDGSLPISISWKGGVNGKVSVTFNNDFNLTAQTITPQTGQPATINFDYDNDGLLTNAGDLSLNYDSSNGFLTGTVIDSVTDTYSYNNLGEINNYNTKFGSTDLFNTVYSRDSLGRITKIIETVAGNTDTLEYAYSPIGYLNEVKKNGIITSEYEYDSNGNRVKHISGNDTTLAGYDNQDRINYYGNTNYIYTNEGNLRYKIEGVDTTKYTYDDFGNLMKVILPSGNIIEYIVDAQNRRIAKKVNSSIVKKWLYLDQLNPIAELNATDSVIARFVYGSKINTPDYIVKDDSTYKVISDHLGSVRLVVNVATGEIKQQISYDEYGNVLLDTNPGYQPLYFAGGHYELLTAFTRFGLRDYDSFTGIWTVKDPIFFDGGSSNIYEYVYNDPINYIDANGLFAVPADISVEEFFTNPNYGLSLSLELLDKIRGDKYNWFESVSGAYEGFKTIYDSYQTVYKEGNFIRNINRPTSDMLKPNYFQRQKIRALLDYGNFDTGFGSINLGIPAAADRLQTLNRNSNKNCQ